VVNAIEIHKLPTEGDVMNMRTAPGLALPARQCGRRQARGHHVTLLDLKQVVNAGDNVPVMR